jgi:hypothetical protein
MRHITFSTLADCVQHFDDQGAPPPTGTRTVSINLTKTCKPGFVVALTDSKYVPQVAFSAVCSTRPLIITPGTNRLPVRDITTYLECQHKGVPFQPNRRAWQTRRLHFRLTPKTPCWLVMVWPQPVPVILMKSSDLSDLTPACLIVGMVDSHLHVAKMSAPYRARDLRLWGFDRAPIRFALWKSLILRMFEPEPRRQQRPQSEA